MLRACGNRHGNGTGMEMLDQSGRTWTCTASGVIYMNLMTEDLPALVNTHQALVVQWGIADEEFHKALQ